MKWTVLLAWSAALLADAVYAVTVVPTFECAGLYWSPEGGKTNVVASVRYRVANGGAWHQGQDLWYAAAENGRPAEYRGSLVGLKTGTAYEVELDLAGSTPPEVATFSTWSEVFPVAQTFVITNRTTPLEISGVHGSPTGYILYTGPATSDVANAYAYNIRVQNSSYIIIRGLTLTGATGDGILLGPTTSSNSDILHDIIIEGNDISNWGSVNSKASTGTNWGTDDQSGVRSSSSELERIVVQRNRIHHPRTDSNSWKEYNPIISSYHPNGPQGISFEYGTKGHFVIRYNEIIGDNDHRFNDGMGSDNNFGYGGFPIRDSDIYGNYIAYTWDDGLEIEGANQNVRVWGNCTDETYVGTALAGVTMGPLYVFRNVFQRSRTSPSHSYGGGAFKRGGSTSYPSDGRVYLFNNTIYAPVTPRFQTGIGNRTDANYGRNTIARNNILRVRGDSTDKSVYDQAADASYDYDLYNGTISTKNAADEASGIKGLATHVANAGLDTATMRGVFQLVPGTLGYDAGVILPNFTDDFDGAAPDIGAHEANEPPMMFGVKAAPPLDPVPDTTAPAAVTDLSALSTANDRVTLTWTAPGDDAAIGTAAAYEVRYSTSPIDASNWAEAFSAASEPYPASAGIVQSMQVAGLTPGTTYYFAIKTADEVPNWSELSNIASGSPLMDTAVTWVGPAIGDWATSVYWSGDNVPDAADEDVRIDANLGQNSAVTHTQNVGTSVAIGGLTVDAGDALVLTRVNSVAGTASFSSAGPLVNAGTLTTGGWSAGETHGQTFIVTLGGGGGTFNGPGAKFYVKSAINYRRSTTLVNLPANQTNAGEIYVQNISSQGGGNVRLSLTGEGRTVFVNHGSITIEGWSNTTGGNHPWAVVGPGTTLSTLTLEGSGTLTLSSCLGDRLDAFAMITGVASGTALVNAPAHTIQGNGHVGYGGISGTAGNNITVYAFTTFTNEGIVRAIRSTNMRELCIASTGGIVVNTASGRLVSGGDVGTVLRIGSETAAGTFVSDGLIEARAGCQVALATNLATTLRGELRGGGTFAASELVLAEATLAPGDSLGNLPSDDGADDTAIGTLTVEGDLVLSAKTRLRMQLGRAGTAGTDYDTILVSGTSTVSGVVEVVSIPGFAGGTYRLLTCAPGHLIDQGLVVEGAGHLVSDPAAGTLDLIVPLTGTLLELSAHATCVDPSLSLVFNTQNIINTGAL